MSASAAAGATVDRFLGGRVTLVQPEKGHRAGLDAALLQATVPAGATGAAVDMGTGCGTIAFCLAARAPGLRVTGIDVDPGIIALARAGMARPENAVFRDRVHFARLDVVAGRAAREAAGLVDGDADLVIMNPPFAEEARVRASPDAARRRAHVAGNEASLAVWTRTAAALLRSGGRLRLIHRPEALDCILAAFAGRLGGIAVLPVHPRAGAPAGRLLVAGVRGSRAPLRLLPGLVLHRDDGSWSERAAAILKGDAELELEPAR